MLISHHASSVNHRAIAGCVDQVGLCWPASVLNELAEILKDVASWLVKWTPAGVLHLFHPFWIIFPFGRSSPILGYRRWIRGGWSAKSLNFTFGAVSELRETSNSANLKHPDHCWWKLMLFVFLASSSAKRIRCVRFAWQSSLKIKKVISSCLWCSSLANHSFTDAFGQIWILLAITHSGKKWFCL